jgi:cytochrome c oxidase subunit II
MVFCLGAIAQYWLGGESTTASPAFDDLMSQLLVVWAVAIAVVVAFLMNTKGRATGRRTQAKYRRFYWPAVRFGAIMAVFVFLIYVFQSGLKTYLTTVVAPVDALDVKITAAQLDLSAEYPGGVKPDQFVQVSELKNMRAPILQVPTNRPVRLLFTSDDAARMIAIPALRVQFGLMPSKTSTGAFTATVPTPQNELGHFVYSTNIDGQRRSQIIAFIKVVPQTEFDRWMTVQSQPAAPTNPIQLGKLLYAKKGCMACHTTTGGASVGPSWKGLFGIERVFTDGTTAVADDSYLRESIFSPGKKVVEGYINQMPPYAGKISDDETDAIIKYIKSLRNTP